MARNPKYQKGDLVKACYTFYDYYYPDPDDDLFYPWNLRDYGMFRDGGIFRAASQINVFHDRF